MRAALVAHDDVLLKAIRAHGGRPFKHTGDGVCPAFASPRLAVDAAVAAQRALEFVATETAPDLCSGRSADRRLAMSLTPNIIQG